jgi:xanthine dehydrogenase YagS FAD-binding subunit
MKFFKYSAPQDLQRATSLLSQYGNRAKILAGGTDLLGQLKNRIQPTYPEIVIDIKNIANMNEIHQDSDGLKIGALTKLVHVAQNTTILEQYPALSQAASAVASPHIRLMGTIGGNLCQAIRCWYYRAPKNYFFCLRKSGAPKRAICYAIKGENRYHSIYGPMNKCFAVNPSDLAPTVVALKAKLKTTKRVIDATDFYTAAPDCSTILEPDEILTEIQIPKPEKNTKSCFMKYAPRKTIDFPVANCTVVITRKGTKITSCKICLNAVYNIPYRAEQAEQFLIGRSVDLHSAAEAGELAISKAKPLKDNQYIVFIVKNLVTKAVLACT